MQASVELASRAAFWGLLFVACARLGARAVGSRRTGLAHLAWDGATGLALLMALLVAIGVMPDGFRVVVVRCAIAGAIALAGFVAWRDPVARFRSVAAHDRAGAGIVVLLAALAVAGLAWDRVPPVFFDTRAYHFAFPELWLIVGRVTPFTWSVLSWFPPGMSMLYGVGLATGGEAWANDANILVGLCLIAMTFDLARRLFGRGAGWLAAVFVAAVPLILYALAIPGADLAHGLFTFGALGSLLLRSEDDASWLKRAGLLTAGAVLTKYLGLIVPLALGVAWLGARRERVSSVVRFALPASLLFVPWLAANTLVVGNPVAPTASSIFPTRGLAPGWSDVFRGDTRGGLPGWNDVRSLPSRWVTGSEPDSRVYPTPAWGWLPILLVPFAAFAARDDRSLRRLLALIALLLGVWFVSFRWERFLVATAAFVAVASAGGVIAAARRRTALRLLPVLMALAAGLSVVPSLVAIGRFDGGARVALGRESPAAFIEGGLASARLFHRANDTLHPRRDLVLLVGEMRHYGLAVPRVAPTGFNTHPLVEALREDPDPTRVNAKLRQLGFTHLIVDLGWVARSGSQYPSLAWLTEHPDVLPAYLASLGAPVAVEGGVALFRMPQPGAGRRP